MFTDQRVVNDILRGVNFHQPSARRVGAAAGYLHLGMLSLDREGIHAELGTDKEGEIAFIPGRWRQTPDGRRFVTKIRVIQPTVDRFIESQARGSGQRFLSAATRPAGSSSAKE